MDSIKVASVSRVKLVEQSAGDRSAPRVGSLHLTPHHLIFRSNGSPELWTPHPLLYSVTRVAPNLTGTEHPMVIRTRDFKVYELTFDKSEEADGVWDSLKGLCTSVAHQGVENLFAFVHAADRKGKGKAGWSFYEPAREFERMGVGKRTKAWRISKINADYEFCSSYPADIGVPAKISDSTLAYAVKYRSKGRLPGLVYLHHANLPMVGMKLARSIQDEKLIEAIFTSHSQHSTLAPRNTFNLASPSASSSTTSLDSTAGQVVYGAQSTNLIIDARPTKNAVANSVKGAGTENMDHYKNCKKAYLGIDNIHVMRSSLTGIYDALRESETTGHLDRNALRRTQWLKHLSNILEGTLIITRTVHLSNSHVLVHCSDGWDRTSQLSSLAQLCLDPFYRTAKGFAILVEKDWLSFGHRFSDRTGHLCGDRTEFAQPPAENLSAQQSFLATVQRQFQGGGSHAYKETCPVFAQFLDCIVQILRQFPDRFEFNESFLRRLHWETYSTESGTFLFNSEAERVRLGAKERTTSAWASVMHDDGAMFEEFRNSLYDPELDDPDSRAINADQGVLLVDPQNVKWWHELFGRTDEEMNGRPEPEGVADEAHKAVEPDAVVIVDEGDADPLAATLTNTTLSSASPSSRGSPLPGVVAASGVSLPSQVQLADAVSSVQKFGWGAWKAAQKSYQDALAAAAAASTPAAPSDDASTQRHSRTLNGQSSDSGWKATGGNDSAELDRTSSLRHQASDLSTSTWSRISTPAPSGNSRPSSPVKSRDDPAPYSSTSDAASPRKAPLRTSSPAPAAVPLPPPILTRPAPSRHPLDEDLSTDKWSSDPRRASDQDRNPWERPSQTRASQPPPAVSSKSESKGGDVDPLGVGFS